MAIAALLTFLAVFIVSTAVILKRDQAFIDRMAHLPLEDGFPENTQTEKSHEA